MILLNTLLLVFALAPSMQEMLREYRLQLKADALYERRAYSEAESVFRQLEALPEQKERGDASFNLACALYMQGKYHDAATLFALRTKPESKNRDVRLKAIFNEGNALAMKAIGSSGKAEKITLFRQSLNRFKALLLTNPDEGDAKINYEIVRRYLDELERSEHATASGSGKKSDTPPTSGISRNTAERLLENAQQDESALMRRLPRTGKSSAPGSKNNHDW
ncbi:MAG: tetratricopeptide repeat protein [Chlorobiaceae bacterium]|nr:tetratricopeptide repeat protein [Chlorobiaceae bacterium]